eukprot:Sspe_Gene.23683::Locus_9242_Transcript_1_1_Confidence_1.000_Length_4150::g.23683::m.23683
MARYPTVPHAARAPSPGAPGPSTSGRSKGGMSVGCARPSASLGTTAVIFILLHLMPLLAEAAYGACSHETSKTTCDSTLGCLWLGTGETTGTGGYCQDAWEVCASCEENGVGLGLFYSGPTKILGPSPLLIGKEHRMVLGPIRALAGGSFRTYMEYASTVNMDHHRPVVKVYRGTSVSSSSSNPVLTSLSLECTISPSVESKNYDTGVDSTCTTGSVECCGSGEGTNLWTVPDDGNGGSTYWVEIVCDTLYGASWGKIKIGYVNSTGDTQCTLGGNTCGKDELCIHHTEDGNSFTCETVALTGNVMSSTGGVDSSNLIYVQPTFSSTVAVNQGRWLVATAKVDPTYYVTWSKWTKSPLAVQAGYAHLPCTSDGTYWRCEYEQYPTDKGSPLTADSASQLLRFYLRPNPIGNSVTVKYTLQVTNFSWHDAKATITNLGPTSMATVPFRVDGVAASFVEVSKDFVVRITGSGLSTNDAAFITSYSEVHVSGDGVNANTKFCHSGSTNLANATLSTNAGVMEIKARVETVGKVMVCYMFGNSWNTILGMKGDSSQQCDPTSSCTNVNANGCHACSDDSTPLCCPIFPVKVAGKAAMDTADPVPYPASPGETVAVRILANTSHGTANGGLLHISMTSMIGSAPFTTDTLGGTRTYCTKVVTSGCTVYWPAQYCVADTWECAVPSFTKQSAEDLWEDFYLHFIPPPRTVGRLNGTVAVHLFYYTLLTPMLSSAAKLRNPFELVWEVDVRGVLDLAIISIWETSSGRPGTDQLSLTVHTLVRVTALLRVTPSGNATAGGDKLFLPLAGVLDSDVRWSWEDNYAGALSCPSDGTQLTCNLDGTGFHFGEAPMHDVFLFWTPVPSTVGQWPHNITAAATGFADGTLQPELLVESLVEIFETTASPPVVPAGGNTTLYYEFKSHGRSSSGEKVVLYNTAVGQGTTPHFAASPNPAMGTPCSLTDTGAAVHHAYWTCLLRDAGMHFTSVGYQHLYLFLSPASTTVGPLNLTTYWSASDFRTTEHTFDNVTVLGTLAVHFADADPPVSPHGGDVVVHYRLQASGDSVSGEEVFVPRHGTIDDATDAVAWSTSGSGFTTCTQHPSHHRCDLGGAGYRFRRHPFDLYLRIRPASTVVGPLDTMITIRGSHFEDMLHTPNVTVFGDVYIDVVAVEPRDGITQGGQVVAHLRFYASGNTTTRETLFVDPVHYAGTLMWSTDNVSAHATPCPNGRCDLSQLTVGTAQDYPQDVFIFFTPSSTTSLGYTYIPFVTEADGFYLHKGSIPVLMLGEITVADHSVTPSPARATLPVTLWYRLSSTVNASDDLVVTLLTRMTEDG